MSTRDKDVPQGPGPSEQGGAGQEKQQKPTTSQPEGQPGQQGNPDTSKTSGSEQSGSSY